MRKGTIMAVTISRLYDRYADAERAVSQLESSWHPTILISASSQTIPTSGTIAAKRIGTATASMTAQKALAREPELAPALVARLAFSPAWGYLRSLGLGR